MISASRGSCQLLIYGHHRQRFYGQKLLPKLLLRALSTNSPIGTKEFDFEQVFKNGTPPEYFNFATDVFDSHVVRNPSRLAFWVESDSHSRQWSFTQLRTESVRAAIALLRAIDPSAESKSLKNVRIPPSTSLFVLLPRIPEWWFIHSASLRLGTIVTPATTQLTPEDIAYRLQTGTPDVVVTDDENMWKIEEAQRIQPLKKPPVKIVIPKRRRYDMTAENWIRFDDLTEDVTDSDILAFRDAVTRSSDISQVFFTSGTTGKPKRVAHSHSSYGIGHYHTARLKGIRENDLYWNISDPGWAKSAYGNFYSPWIPGASVYIHQMDRFEVKKILEILCTRPINGFCAPPTLFRAIVQETDLSLFKFMSLEYAVTGGETVQVEVIRKWEEKTGIPLRALYGQTETTASIAYETSDTRKEHSMGFPKFGFDIRITDEKGVELERGKEGNIAIKIKPTRPIGFFKGYLKEGVSGIEIDEEHKAFVGDYYLSGDRGIQDDEGHIYYVGRDDDVIISAGYRIGPNEVESALQMHPAVAENACVSSPHTSRGSVVKAFIVLSKEYKGRSDSEKAGLVAELQNFCKAHTAPYKYPRRIEFVEELPKTVSGKILRRELKKLEEERHRDQVLQDPHVGFAQDHAH